MSRWPFRSFIGSTYFQFHLFFYMRWTFFASGLSLKERAFVPHFGLAIFERLDPDN